MMTIPTIKTDFSVHFSKRFVRMQHIDFLFATLDHVILTRLGLVLWLLT